MQLFYHPEAASVNQKIAFDKDESRHIVKVLRKQAGDKLQLTNGKGDFFTSEIIDSHHNKCVINLLEKETPEPLPYHLHLAVAPTKLNDRYEWFLEKAVEIGVHEITPIICDHSERTKIKEERYEKIILSAMKQSLKAELPKLNAAISFTDFIKGSSFPKTNRFIAHCAPGEKNSLKEVLKPKEQVLILIGPEGDFSEKEINRAIENGFSPVSLGNSRLRTETAAVVACHSVAFVNE
jgi:16S rRNA (uracil1498-N3)-methyltransferase